MKGECLDFRGLKYPGLLYTYVRRKDAEQQAVKCGWKIDDCTLGANRFRKFWVVCCTESQTELRLLGRDGTWIDVPYPGRW